MQVIHREEIGPNHSIEIGWSTWNPREVSIRNRYDSPDGRFRHTASSEIPINDLPDLLRIALQKLPEVLGAIQKEGGQQSSSTGYAKSESDREVETKRVLDDYGKKVGS